MTIAGDGGVNEGFNAEFTLTASKPVLSSSKPLNVSVLLSESEDMVASAEEGTKTVSFAMGDTTATPVGPTVDDGVVESDSVVTAAIQTNTELHGRDGRFGHGERHRPRRHGEQPRDGRADDHRHGRRSGRR